MTFCVENETNEELSFGIKPLFEKVGECVLEMEQCQYEACVNLLLTDNDGIRRFNEQYRQIDRETDVLSFPNVDFDIPGDFSGVENDEADYFDPDSGELMLGDIIISIAKAKAQASEYGHSLLREVAFLIVHSMFHLCGYDHMEPAEAERMEAKQNEALKKLGIGRE